MGLSMSEKVRANRLRRVADRRGYQLHKTRRLDPQALDYGRWTVTSPNGATAEYTSLDEVEQALDGHRAWSTPEEPKAAGPEDAQP